jgi:hypothetical protein
MIVSLGIRHLPFEAQRSPGSRFSAIILEHARHICDVFPGDYLLRAVVVEAEACHGGAQEVINRAFAEGAPML